jgi:hypothetical protein
MRQRRGHDFIYLIPGGGSGSRHANAIPPTNVLRSRRPMRMCAMSRRPGCRRQPDSRWYFVARLFYWRAARSSAALGLPPLHALMTIAHFDVMAKLMLMASLGNGPVLQERMVLRLVSWPARETCLTPFLGTANLPFKRVARLNVPTTYSISMSHIGTAQLAHTGWLYVQNSQQTPEQSDSSEQGNLQRRTRNFLRCQGAFVSVVSVHSRTPV